MVIESSLQQCSVKVAKEISLHLNYDFKRRLNSGYQSRYMLNSYKCDLKLGINSLIDYVNLQCKIATLMRGCHDMFYYITGD